MKLQPRFISMLLLSCLLGTLTQAQVKLKSVQISFNTPSGDDKDWDTKVTVSLYLSDGTLVGTADHNACNATTPAADVAKCFCCVPVQDSHGNPTSINTRFANGSMKGPFEIKVSNAVEKQKIKTGYFKVKIRPVGNDRWIFVPTVTLRFDDNSIVSLTNYPPTIVAQDAPETTFVFH